MKGELAEVYAPQDTAEHPFQHFHELLVRPEQFHQSYSFFNLDVLEISRNYPRVSA